MKNRIVFIMGIISLIVVSCGNEIIDPMPSSSTEGEVTDIVVTDVDTTIDDEVEMSADSNMADSDADSDTEEMADASDDYLGSYQIKDTGFGAEVNVVVDSEARTRTITSNALPNHETGNFPNEGNPNTISEQEKSWTYPIDPVFSGEPTFAREPGVGINGVKFEPETAERVTCETGEIHNIEAIQDVASLGLDFNNAHVQPTGEYHYHGVSSLLVDLYSSDQDLVHLGFAADGHLIYYSKSGAYKPSYQLGTGERDGENCVYDKGPLRDVYVEFGTEKDGSLKSDWDYDATYGELDQCNGIMIDDEYIYLLTNEYPYIPRCLMGEFRQARPGGEDRDDAGQGADRTPNDRPDFAAAAATLGITEQALIDAVGGPPPNFENAANILNLSAEEIETAVESSRTGAGAEPIPERNREEDDRERDDQDAASRLGNGRLFELPGDNIYPEGVSYNPANGKFYVGSTTDGTLYEGNVNGNNMMTVFSEGGADGRTATAGTKVDSDGNLWVAGNNTGKVWVYDTESGDLITMFTTPEGAPAFINDLAITDDAVYFTDSFRPTIWKVSGLAGGEAEAWLDLTGTAINYVAGFNLNGIVATADEKTLIVVHSGEGELYKIDIPTKAVSWINTGITPLTAGDGLALIDDMLYVTRNNFGEIVPVKLNPEMSSGMAADVITNDLFGYPTTIAFTGDSFLVANSQFNNRTAGTPTLPFTIAQILYMP